MKFRLLATRFPYAVTEHIFKIKVPLLLVLMSAAFSYSVSIVKNNKSVTILIDDPPMEVQMKATTYLK